LTRASHTSTIPWADLGVDHPVCYTFGGTDNEEEEGGYGAYWVTQVSYIPLAMLITFRANAETPPLQTRQCLRLLLMTHTKG
jgi:hypothetical protein